MIRLPTVHVGGRGQLDRLFSELLTKLQADTGDYVPDGGRSVDKIPLDASRLALPEPGFGAAVDLEGLGHFAAQELTSRSPT